jgi:hypothetical protein
MVINGLKNHIYGLESMFRPYPTNEKEFQTSRGQDLTTNMELIVFLILENANQVQKT